MSHANPRLAAGVVVAVLVGVAAAPVASAGHAYEQGVWFNRDTTELDVQVVGVDDPAIGRAIKTAVVAWETGIDDLDPNGLGQELTIREYVPGQDPTPPPGYEPDDPEIVVAPQGFFAVRTDPCVATAPFAPYSAYGGVLGAPDVGEHTREAQYRVAAHELGHCLGLEHVFDHGDEYEPDFDIMGNGFGHWPCPSNLNVQVLQKVYDGEQGDVTISSGDYNQSACANDLPVVPT